jgi:DNA polymerase III epsilon subunit-like protein
VSDTSSVESMLNADEIEDHIVRADDFPIDNSEFHGVTLERSLLEGKPFQELAELFISIFQRSDLIIVHNSDFDMNVLKSELFRYNRLDLITQLETIPVICSMKSTKYIVNSIDRIHNRIKYPSLLELYTFATGKTEMNSQHNSKYDVIHLKEAITQLTINGKYDIYNQK